VIQPTFDGWRAAARALLAAGVEPREVLWEEAEGEQPGLPGLVDEAPAEAAPSTARVPRAFMALAEAGACHSDAERWALLYRVLWRVTHGEPRLMEVAMDPDVHRMLAMEKSVRRDVHKTKAFVRFRAVDLEVGTHYVAWFEPEHRTLERSAPFFAERFASMSWSILTPRRCAHWDGDGLWFSAGVPRSAAPGEDALEGLWRTYYASIFNPARMKPKAMRAEMPLKYWRNLPEAELIQPLMREAPARVRRMIEEQSAERNRPSRDRPRRSP
jgi:DNA polymerase